jgi:hypothetical protein
MRITKECGKKRLHGGWEMQYSRGMDEVGDALLSEIEII